MSYDDIIMYIIMCYTHRFVSRRNSVRFVWGVLKIGQSASEKKIMKKVINKYDSKEILNNVYTEWFKIYVTEIIPHKYS